MPADWFGIYRKISYHGNEVLVKEAYTGEPSRAIFPLTNEFAEISNNSWVGMKGIGKVIQDVNNYDGPYYGNFLKFNEKILRKF